MNIVYTYWTNEGTNYINGYYNEDLFKKLFMLSVNSLNKYNITIYTDQHGFNYLKTFLPEYVRYELVDYSQYEFNKKFWNFPKLITYSLQNEAFIHVDYDLFFLKEPNFTKCDIITEKTRYHYIFKTFADRLKLPIDKFPLNIVCSGLIGGTNTDIFKELFNIAKKAVITEIDVHFNHLVSIEEIMLTSLINSSNLKVYEVEEKFIHLQGTQKKYDKHLNEVNEIYKNCFMN